MPDNYSNYQNNSLDFQKGEISSSVNQPYERILHAERPVHLQDAFSAKHPPMPREKRAKLFAAFDALSGYDEAIAAQEIVYENRSELGETMQEDLNIKLRRLREALHIAQQKNKYRGGCQSAANHRLPEVSITYFEEASGQNGRGHYREVTGIVCKMNSSNQIHVLATDAAYGLPQKTVTLSFRDIIEINIKSSE